MYDNFGFGLVNVLDVNENNDEDSVDYVNL